jgi:hypothetical protein
MKPEEKKSEVRIETIDSLAGWGFTQSKVDTMNLLARLSHIRSIRMG